MSALVGRKGSKSAIVGDGGRVLTNQIYATSTSASDQTNSYTGVGFTPRMLFCAGHIGLTSESGHSCGYGFASQFASTTLREQATYGVGGNSITTDGGRWEGPYTTSGNSTPVTEGMLFRQTGGSQYLWQARVNSIDSDGVTLWFDAVYGVSTSRCHLRIIAMR